MKYYLKALQNYATFSGRARRSEFWYFTLYNTIFVFIAIMIDVAIGKATQEKEFIPIIYMLYILFVLVPCFSVFVRRIHDVGKSGWFILIAAIPIAGPIWLWVLMATNGDVGKNKYGVDPKEIS
ncbi:DUF805 domain-containing protein [Flavobacterium soyangense]|uniref:DUF805 domain-containing protein n=1 Tax=Flavobacterium soyangense TaxID=2023265 RepID=A0A930UEB4_9FLAO|nr:DUF805 domain-containing protein [Flavobacterium soyangense]MBF2709317.1 DUF805 domain-containing protein [Flavobacterium soyangense]